MLRPAQGDEIAELRRITLAAYAIHLPRMDRRPAPMDADFALLVSQGRVFVPSGKPLAGLIHAYRDGPVWRIDNLAVDPKASGTGLGSRILAASEAMGLAQGCREAHLYTNAAMEENIGFYGRRGYAQTARRRAGGFDRIFFCKTLMP